MALMPLRSAKHGEAGVRARPRGWRVRHTPVAYAVAGSIGFGMQNRSQLAGSQ
jgi:hypothetical protein